MSKKMLALVLSSVAVLAACDEKEVQKVIDEMDKDLPAVEQNEDAMEDNKQMDAEEKDAMKKDDSMGEDEKKMEDDKMMDGEEKMDDEKEMMDDNMDDEKEMKDDPMVKGDAEVKVDAEVEMNDDKDEEPSAMKKSSGQYVAYSDGVIGNGQKSVLFFHATWCPACKQNDQYLKDWYGSEDFPVSVYKIDYDTATELKEKYGITGQDTFVQIDGSGNAITQARFPSQSALRGLLQ